MNVLQTHTRIVSDYSTYIRSFLKIADPAIREGVEAELDKGKLWPEPLLQFNPSFEMFGSLDSLVEAGTLHRDIRDIFTGYRLYRHHVEAIKLGIADEKFGRYKAVDSVPRLFHAVGPALFVRFVWLPAPQS